ncbi:MAG: hypothetical protein KY457_13255, partial [Actinobacteria bacterium]|nr:hypothetical protein [Actinomycetota bacterium]
MVEDTTTTSPGPTNGGAAPTRPDDVDAATTGKPDDGAERAPRRARRWWVLPWLVAAVAVLVAMATTSQWLALRAEDQTRQQVLRAAEEFVVALTTWDASDGLQDTRDELRAAGTGTFLTEVDELFGGSFGEELEEVEAVSTGDVQDVFVQRIQEDEAIALGVVVQEVSTNLTDTPSRTVRSARMTLTREGDRWLVSSVQLLADDVEGAAPAE